MHELKKLVQAIKQDHPYLKGVDVIAIIKIVCAARPVLDTVCGVVGDKSCRVAAASDHEICDQFEIDPE